MAFLRTTPKSSFWILKYRDLETGRWREVSTRCRIDDAKDTRRAQRLAEEASKKEAQAAPQQGAFSEWTATYLENHFANARSKKRYDLAWQRCLEWMRVRNIRHASEVKYEHAADFMDWRKDQGASHNTARLELKLFSFVMQEALRREICVKNPLALAKVPRTPPKPKKELALEEFAAARAAFADRAPWMLTVFEICAHLGCRFNEAEFGKEDVDFGQKIIWLTDSKRKEGDPRKRYAVPMPEGLAKHLQAAFKKRDRTSGRLTGDQNRVFNSVLKAACGATSHSLRVSFVTRCHRAGLSESQAMRLVNHSTRLVHAVYSKLNLNDARAAAALVPPPGAPENPAPTARSSSGRKKGTPSA
jgi:site-specific recombinase XerD